MEVGSEMRQSRFKRICVFCGSSQGKKSSYQDSAIELGKELVYIYIHCFLCTYYGFHCGMLGLSLMPSLGFCWNLYAWYGLCKKPFWNLLNHCVYYNLFVTCLVDRLFFFLIHFLKIFGFLIPSIWTFFFVGFVFSINYSFSLSLSLSLVSLSGNSATFKICHLRDEKVIPCFH